MLLMASWGKGGFIMIDQVDTENTDMGTYLGRIGSSLTKEGHSLQALARM